MKGVACCDGDEGEDVFASKVAKKAYAGDAFAAESSAYQREVAVAAFVYAVDGASASVPYREAAGWWAGEDAEGWNENDALASVTSRVSWAAKKIE